MDGALSIADAVEAGIERIRQPNWVNKLDHLKIDIIDGKPGPWLHLYAPFNQECSGFDPFDIFWMIDPRFDIHAADFEIYNGPLPESDEYKTAAGSYNGLLKKIEQ